MALWFYNNKQIKRVLPLLATALLVSQVAASTRPENCLQNAFHSILIENATAPTASTRLHSLTHELSSKNLTARTATNQDAPKILDFIKNSRRSLGENTLRTKRFRDSIDRDLRDIERIYHNNYGEFIILENPQGAIVGTAALARIGPDTAEISKLYIAPEVRSIDTERALLNHLRGSAQAKGYSQLEVETISNTNNSKHLYESLGFKKSTSSQTRIQKYYLQFEAPQAASQLESPTAKTAFFNEIARTIETHKDRIARILRRVDTPAGVDYELRQAIDTLRNVEKLELQNLQNTRRLQNVAVYGSTNIPLYTMIMHGFLPLSITDNVWFRTPAATRAIYRDLFHEISLALPPGRLKGLNILAKAKDTQYDTFRKTYVLGLNKKGKHLERPPSEVVIFTGNPETGRKILADNAKKLTAIAKPDESYKQVFLGFGTGMNPMIVTGDAARNLDVAIDATLDSIKINCGQDCIAPNFYMVNQAVVDQYVAGIITRIDKMKPGRTGDRTAGYSPVTFSEDVKKLQDYRAKYEKFLVNPSATIDPTEKLVSPHVFVFPNGMFEEVSLQEHYGPFITIFKYDNPADLGKMAKDPRVQKKAMYASVFGDTQASEEVTQAIDTLQQNRHSVSFNTSVYSDESGNLPFGGVGEDSSIVGILFKEAGSTAELNESHRAILFSKEALSAYGR